jgi:hypothetical protein
LAGEDVGRVRDHTIALARVLSEHRGNRPVVAVWTKSDKSCDEEVEGPIRTRLDALFGAHTSLNLSVEDSKCVSVLAELLKDQPTRQEVASKVGGASPFLAYGASHDNG